MRPNLKKYERLAKQILDSLRYEVVITASRFDVENEDNCRFVFFEGVYTTGLKKGVFSVWGVVTPAGNLILTAPKDENEQDIPKRGFRASDLLAREGQDRHLPRSELGGEEPAVQVLGNEYMKPRAPSAPTEIVDAFGALLCDRAGRLLPRVDPTTLFRV